MRTLRVVRAAHAGATTALAFAPSQHSPETHVRLVTVRCSVVYPTTVLLLLTSTAQQQQEQQLQLLAPLFLCPSKVRCAIFSLGFDAKIIVHTVESSGGKYRLTF